MNEHFVTCLLVMSFVFAQTVQSIQPTNLNNQTLLVSAIFEEPFLMLKRNQYNTANEASISPGTVIDPSLVQGYSVDLANILCHDKLKLPYKFVIETQYGKETERGVWNGIVGTLIRRGADLSIAPLTITETREKVVDFSKPFMVTGIGILVRKPMQQISEKFVFTRSRAIQIGIVAIISYLIIRILLFLISQFSTYFCRFERKANDEQQRSLSIQDALFLSLSVFLHQNNNTLPKPLPARLTKLAWCCFGLIIALILAGNLILCLRNQSKLRTVETAQRSIETVEDLVRERDIRFGTIKSSSTAAFFNTSTNDIFKYMWNIMEQYKDDVFVSSKQEGVDKVLRSNGKYAFMTESTIIDYTIKHYPCQLMRLGENLDTKGFGVATPMGSNLREMINKAIAELQANGTLEVLKRKWYYARSDCRNFFERDSDRKIRFDWVFIGTMFYNLFMFICVAIVISIIEFLIRIKLRSKPSNQNTDNTVASS